MVNILLICTSGISTRKVVENMREHAKKLKVDVEVNSIGDAEKTTKIYDADIILLGPQIRYTIDEVKALVKDSDVQKVKVMNSQDYGLLRGDLILNDALHSLGIYL